MQRLTNNFSVALLFAAIAVGSGGLTGCFSVMQRQDLMHVDCLQAPDPGPCKGAETGFYYDYRTDTCKRFQYGDCHGLIPFQSMAQCVKSCGGKAAGR